MGGGLAGSTTCRRASASAPSCRRCASPPAAPPGRRPRRRSPRSRPTGRSARSTAPRPPRSPTTGTTTSSWATPGTRRCGRPRAFAGGRRARARSPRSRPTRSPAGSARRCSSARTTASSGRRSTAPRRRSRPAVALGLDAERTAHALAIALYQPPYGLWPGFMGPQTKLLTAAEPAAAGARAALLAAEGVTGALDVIEHPRGLLATSPSRRGRRCSARSAASG